MPLDKLYTYTNNLQEDKAGFLAKGKINIFCFMDGGILVNMQMFMLASMPYRENLYYFINVSIHLSVDSKRKYYHIEIMWQYLRFIGDILRSGIKQLVLRSPLHLAFGPPHFVLKK